MSLDLPGVDASDVSIELLDGELKVGGVRKIEDVAEGDRVMQDTRKQGAFENTFKFESMVDEDKIEASYENGVLEIVVPKAAKPVARKIEIKTGNAKG